MRRIGGRWGSLHRDPDPASRASGPYGRSWQSMWPERGRPAAEARSARTAALLARTVRKARLCRPCAAGAALSPGPTGLDRRNDLVRGTLHRWRGCCRPRLASSRPSGTRRCLLHDEKAPSRSAVMTPRDGALRADEVVASHSAADGAGPSIEGARTYAHGISRGAVVAVSCVWSRVAPFLSFLSFLSYLSLAHLANELQRARSYCGLNTIMYQNFQLRGSIPR